MKRVLAVAALSVACLSATTGARAGVFSDDLGRCLVSSSNAADKSTLVVWIYGAMSVHPGIKRYSTMTDAERAANNRAAGELFVRLLAVDCHAQTVAALKNEGPTSFESAFEMLGKVAMGQLMQDPGVNQNMGAFAGDMAKDQRFVSLLKEAGGAN